MPGIYGGDDISAIVVDPGSSSLRAGWAGEDTPRALIPSYYGWMPASDEELQMQIGSRSEAAANGDAMEGVETADGGAVEGENGETKEPGEAALKKAGPSDWEVQKLKSESRKRFVGDSGVNIWRPDMEIGNPFEDGICESKCSGGMKDEPAHQPKQ